MLAADPGVDSYSAIAITILAILVAGGARRKALLQPYYLFCLFFFFYNFTSHFLYELSGLAVLGAFHSDANRDNIVHQALIAYCFLVACAPWFAANNGTNRAALFARLEEIRRRIEPRRLAALSIISFMMTFAVFSPMAPIVLQNGFIDRVLSSAYINSNVWLIVGLLSYVGSFLSILSMKSHRGYAAFALALFGSYFVMDMAIGGRKILSSTRLT